MKKSIIILILLIGFPITVNAASIGISCPSSVTVGDTITCSITAYHSSLSGLTAAVSYSGMTYNSSTNNTGANYFSVSENRLDGVFDISNSSKNVASYKFNTSSSGTASFNVSNVKIVDGESFSEISGSGSSKTITINPKQESRNDTPSNNTPSNNIPSNNNSNNTKTQKSTTTTTTKPVGNTYLSYLSVEGLEIAFNKETLEYNLNVANNIKTLVIKAEPEDKNSTVKINGDVNLKEGDNKLEIVVTSSDNTTKVYVLNVKREELLSTVNNDLEMLKKALNQDQNQVIVKVDINDQNKNISTEILKILKEKKKNIIYEIYDKNIKIYSFKIIGKNIDKTDIINFNISFSSNYGNNIKNIFKNNKYKIVNFTYSGNLPKNTVISIFDKELNNISYLYYYNPNTNEVEYINSNKKEKDYITFNIDHCSEYVLSNNKLKTSTNNVKTIAITIILIEIAIIVFILFKCKIIKLKPKAE